MSDGRVVLDASALLALLQNEAGAERVADHLSGGAMSAVNLSEVVAKLIDHGMPADDVREALDGLPLDVHAFDREAAFAASHAVPVCLWATKPALLWPPVWASRRSRRIAHGPRSRMTSRRSH